MTADRALIALVLLLLTAAGGYWAGDHQRDNAWKAKEARIVSDAHKKYEAEVKRGNEAVGNYLDAQHEQETRYAELENKFEALRKRVPLLVPPAAGEAPASAVQAGAAAAPCINFVMRPQLSLAAVWMWNSSLDGRDVPAGACGADAASGEACAAGAGLTLEDAWANHAINAKSCAADRLRYERLIDYLQNRTPPPREQ